MHTPGSVVRSLILFLIAGLCEIGGGWLVWKSLRDGRPAWWGLAGAIVLILYGIIPTLQASHFGRIYAVYGGFFIVLSLLWGWKFDGNVPDRADVIGGCIALVGVCVMMYWPRPAPAEPPGGPPPPVSGEVRAVRLMLLECELATPQGKQVAVGDRVELTRDGTRGPNWTATVECILSTDAQNGRVSVLLRVLEPPDFLACPAAFRVTAASSQIEQQAGGSAAVEGTGGKGLCGDSTDLPVRDLS
jgi:small multidrug resistance family-3 protein